jgi:hypothetical protein
MGHAILLDSCWLKSGKLMQKTVSDLIVEAVNRMVLNTKFIGNNFKVYR